MNESGRPDLRAQRWLDLHATDLLGRTRAEAIELVEQTDFELRVFGGEATWLTQEFEYDRLNIWLNTDGRVVRSWAG